MIDGLSVIKVPANRHPADFGFMIAHYFSVLKRKTGIK